MPTCAPLGWNYQNMHFVSQFLHTIKCISSSEVLGLPAQASLLAKQLDLAVCLVQPGLSESGVADNVNSANAHAAFPPPHLPYAAKAH